MLSVVWVTGSDPLGNICTQGYMLAGEIYFTHCRPIEELLLAVIGHVISDELQRMNPTKLGLYSIVLMIILSASISSF